MRRLFQTILRGFGWKVGSLVAFALFALVVKAFSGWSM